MFCCYYKHSQHHINTTIGSVSATWALATVALFLRFVCRRISKANLWWDDYLMIPAYLFTSVVSWVSLTYMPNNGFGRHIFIQPPEKIPGVVMAFLKSLFIAEVCYTGTIVFAKFSILAFYWRLFKTNPLVRYSIFVLGTIVSMWGTAVVSFGLLPSHLSKSYNSTSLLTVRFTVHHRGDTMPPAQGLLG